jgi:hypothetical protein
VDPAAGEGVGEGTSDGQAVAPQVRL